MKLPTWLETRLMQVCDLVFAVIPQQTPTLEKLGQCKIISHRGQHDNQEIFENTLTAFDHALETDGIWGIELDFRWTKDLYPVVSQFLETKSQVLSVMIMKLKYTSQTAPN